MNAISLSLLGLAPAVRQASVFDALVAYRKSAVESEGGLPDVDPEIFGEKRHGGGKERADVCKRRLDALHAYLLRHGPLRSRDISPRFGLPTDSITRDLRRLRDAGLAERDEQPEYVWSAI